MATARLRHVLGRLDRLKDWEKSSRLGMAAAVTPQPCADLLSLLGEPQRRFQHIHVAGSKGKGSTSALLGAALEEAGWRCAVLSSPHVECVTERVRIKRQPIGAGALADALGMALQARAAAEHRGSAGGAASWFDTFVAGSLLACAEARVDWAVVECGLGGRCDSTNVLGGPVALLTSVELEHTEVLGSTLEAIAREKGAIASPGGALLACVPASLSPVVRSIARERQVSTCVVLPRSDLASADNLELARLALDELGRRGATCASGTPGSRLSRRLLSALQVQRAREAIPGRTEMLMSACGVRVLLDAAHTPASARALVVSARRLPAVAGSPPVLLVGMLDDKDHLAVASELRSLSPPHAVCVTLSDRPHGADSLSRAMGAAGAGSVSVAPDAASGLDTALAAARRCDTWLVIAGSFRLCGAVRPLLRAEAWPEARGDTRNGDTRPSGRGEQRRTDIEAEQGLVREAVEDGHRGSAGDMRASTAR
jgi:dihydrofolate synthase/folylpolyglutamate synthase